MQPMRRETGRPNYRDELFELIRARSFGRGKIMLASGRESDFYFDLRPTTLHPAGATCIGELMCDALEGTERRIRRRARGGRDRDCNLGRRREPSARRKPPGVLRAQEAEGSRRQEMIEGLPKGESLKGQATSRWSRT